MTITPEQLTNRFGYHPPSSDEVRIRHENVRGVLLATAQAVVDLTEPSREQSTAISKLEEAMFWANAAIARLQTPADPTAQNVARVVAPVEPVKPVVPVPVESGHPTDGIVVDGVAIPNEAIARRRAELIEQGQDVPEVFDPGSPKLTDSQLDRLRRDIGQEA